MHNLIYTVLEMFTTFLDVDQRLHFPWNNNSINIRIHLHI